MVDVDAVILGAGAAGLAAARRLAARKRAVVVLEARERVGGRAFTLEGTPAPFPIELGAEFVHGRPKSTLSLLREIGAFEVDIVGGTWQERNGALEPSTDRFELAARMLRHVDEFVGADESIDAYLARFASDPRVSEARESARAVIEGFDAADPARASVRAIAEEWNSVEGIQAESRPSRGYGPVMRHLAQGLDPAYVHLRLQTVVEQIAWQPNGVVVSARGPAGATTFRARRAIVTLPIGVLQQPSGTPGAVRFDPPLPRSKMQALEHIAMGPVVKVVALFRTRFWERCNHGAYHDAAFFYAKDRPFRTVWTPYPIRAPLLTAWAGGPPAHRLAGLPKDALIGTFLEELSGIFGENSDPRGELVAAFAHDWLADPFARGAYSYVTVGGCGARAALAAPLEGTLFFAGEASADGTEAGTVGGALHTGMRAADELLRAEVYGAGDDSGAGGSSPAGDACACGCDVDGFGKQPSGASIGGAADNGGVAVTPTSSG